ncbi:hypothetical protein NNG48_07320 [Enterococcus faecium]|nr:hypothetical protein [Enterococcus faecium]
MIKARFKEGDVIRNQIWQDDWIIQKVCGFHYIAENVQTSIVEQLPIIPVDKHSRKVGEKA